MLLIVVDGGGQEQTIITPGQETVVDRSGVLAAAVAQNVADANPNRSGFFFQNTSGNDMHVNDVGAAKNALPAAGDGSFKVPAGGTWPPVGYAVSTGAISVIGTINDTYLAREW